MKSLLFLLMILFSISTLGQSLTINITRENSKDKVELNDDYLSLINQEFKIMKRSRISNYKVEGIWTLGEKSKEYAVVELGNNHERLVALGRIINSSKGRIAVLFKDIKIAACNNENDGFSLCTINGSNQIVGLHRYNSDNYYKFEKYWNIDFSKEKFSEFTVEGIQTLDKVEHF